MTASEVEVRTIISKTYQVGERKFGTAGQAQEYRRSLEAVAKAKQAAQALVLESVLTDESEIYALAVLSELALNAQLPAVKDFVTTLATSYRPRRGRRPKGEPSSVA